MENFGFVYDKMSENYNALEQMMGTMYQQLLEDPTNENTKNILAGLGDIGKKMLSSQSDFVSIYADPSQKEALMARLDDKIQVLSNALEETNHKTRM